MKLLFFLVGVSLTLTTAYSQTTTTLVSTDSLRIPTVSSQRYDFYYSARQADALTQISIASYVLSGKLTKNRSYDKTYTEVVPMPKGQPVNSSLDDYVLIGTGTVNDIKPNEDW